MAAAAHSGDRRLRLTVRGVGGGGEDDEHQVGSSGSRPLGEAIRDPTVRGSAGGGFDADKASVGHVNMLSAGCKHTSLDKELTRLISPLFGKCSSLPPVVSSPLSGSLNPRSRVVWPGNRYVSSLSVMSSLVLFFPPWSYQSANGCIPLSFPSARLTPASNLQARLRLIPCRDPQLLKGTTGPSRTAGRATSVTRSSPFPDGPPSKLNHIINYLLSFSLRSCHNKAFINVISKRKIGAFVEIYVEIMWKYVFTQVFHLKLDIYILKLHSDHWLNSLQHAAYLTDDLSTLTRDVKTSSTVYFQGKKKRFSPSIFIVCVFWQQMEEVLQYSSFAQMHS